MIPIWLHQFNRAGITAPDQLRESYPGPIYLKAVDGISWMRAFDPALGADGPTGRTGKWSWADLGPCTPWTVPTATNPQAEGRLTAQLANAAGAVILDLEPYEHFWRGSEADAETFVHAYQEHSVFAVALSIDYRRLPWPGQAFHDLAEHYLPQCYWTTFQRPWLEVLEEATARLAPYGKPIEYVLPGDADPADLEMALGWVRGHGGTASVWVWQTITPENWQLLQSSPAEPPTMPTAQPDPCSDLTTRLGYLQGDAAQAIRDPLKRILKLSGRTSRNPRLAQIRQLTTTALDAVSTLETEGK